MDGLPEGWRAVEAPPEPSTAPPGERTGVRFDRRAVALVFAAGIVLLIAALLLVSTPAGSVERSGGTAVASPGQPVAGGSPAAGAAWMVDVAGAVVRPGLYALPAGSRVADAIRAAGGYGPRVDAAAVAASLNLAEVLRDGAKVTVPERGARSTTVAAAGESGSTGAGSAGGRIDLNTATASQLDTLPGVGPATAAKIIAARAERAFRTVDELLERKIVRASVLDGLRDLVTVGGG